MIMYNLYKMEGFYQGLMQVQHIKTKAKIKSPEKWYDKVKRDQAIFSFDDVGKIWQGVDDNGYSTDQFIEKDQAPSSRPTYDDCGYIRYYHLGYMMKPKWAETPDWAEGFYDCEGYESVYLNEDGNFVVEGAETAQEATKKIQIKLFELLAEAKDEAEAEDLERERAADWNRLVCAGWDGDDDVEECDGDPE